jgi:hypothetical protein
MGTKDWRSTKARTWLRAGLLAVVLVSATVVGVGYVTATENSMDAHLGPDGPTDPSAEIAPPRDDVTVITTDSNTWRGLGVEGPRSRSEIVAFNPNGSILYYDDDRHTRYWDVDPVPGTKTTVEYVYADHVEGPACDSTNASRHAVDQATWDEYKAGREQDAACTRNGVDRVNLTTGEVTPIWSRITPGKDESRYHDADRINATHFVVADIYLDRLFVIDTSTDEIVWTWNASDAFPRESGGPYPGDWTHINDVEVLPDGRFMVSVRNQDRVAFVEPGEGIQEDWTLGEEDDYDILYEQHNPDYIPPERGGPAVVVSDSENNRVQEFQRVDGEWKRTWEWSDARMQWARDADRLPNGNTLITDSNGDRVFEVDPAGEVVWNVNVAFPYEAERLGTGDESSGGPSAAHPEMGADGSSGSTFSEVKRNVGGKYLNGAMYVAPVWMGPLELLALVVGALALLVLVVTELAWLVRSWGGRDAEPREAD